MAEIIRQQDTRREFIDVLIELAGKDDKVILIVPDVGFNYIDEFKKRFPDRFFNFGVTEQSALIIAAGLALSGFKPYVYSMINFVTFRPYEAVRNAICLHKANVKIIGVKGSEKYKFLGFSHNLIHEEEDINICKNMGLDYYLPKSLSEIRDVVIKSYNDQKAAYIRL
jgi:transketolase